MKDKTEKRFQECNKIEKVWRYRWYLALPFVFLWRKMFMEPIPGHEYDEEKREWFETESHFPSGKLVWDLSIGEMQCKMGLYYTSEEVISRIKDRIK